MSEKKKGSVIKIEIKLDDIWIGEDGSISDALKEEIISAFVHKLETQVRLQCEQEGIKKFMELIGTLTQVKAEEFVGMIFKQFVDANESFPTNDKIPYDCRGKSLKDYVWQKLGSCSSYQSFGGILENMAKKLGDELKNRYDTKFATQLVQRLHENKMLKEDVATILLSDQKDG